MNPQFWKKKPFPHAALVAAFAVPVLFAAQHFGMADMAAPVVSVLAPAQPSLPSTAPTPVDTVAAVPEELPQGVVAGVTDDAEVEVETRLDDTATRTVDFVEYAEKRRKKEDVARETTGAPVRLAIPGIGVNAEIEEVALAADGSMAVPRDALDAAWYSLGPRPGESGSAVLNGHVDWTHGTTAVFADLHKVRPGDRITVENDRGVVTGFVVREIRLFDADADATAVFVSPDAKARLNLITCVGKWDARQRQYQQRLVVFAEKEGE